MAEVRQTALKFPYNKNLEEGILGAIMVDSEAIHKVFPVLFADAFGYPHYVTIWNSISELYKERHPIDIITVIESLKKRNRLDEVGGPNAIVEIANRVASGANVEYHARLVIQKWVRRKMVTMFYANLELAGQENNDAIELLSNAQLQLIQVQEFLTVGSGKRLPEVVSKLKARVLAGNVASIFWPTSITDLDRTMGGLRPTELCLIAGRPGSGKTTLAISILANLAFNNIPTAFFTYEMPIEELTTKVVSNRAEIDGNTLSYGRLNDYDVTIFESVCDELTNKPIYIEEGAGMDALQIRSKVLSLIATKGIRVIMIDYLQLMPNLAGSERKSTHDALGETTRMLKNLALETGTAIIALSQLSKETEKNRFARPNLSNLRDSGKLEDNADRVLFVWRPIYHGYDTVDFQGQDISTQGKACIIQAKFRHGPVGECWLRTKLEFSKFENIDGDVYSRIEDVNWDAMQNMQTIHIGASNNGHISDDLPF